MKLNIIHLSNRVDRLIDIHKELVEQIITDYKFWQGIIDVPCCKGISKAHKQIVAHAKRKGLHEVLICEDDCHFTAPGAFDYFLKNKPKEFDIYLGTILDGEIKPDNSVDFFTGLSLYIVHERFYDTFLSINENEYLDPALKNKGKFIVCNPIVAMQKSGYSDNWQKDVDFSSYLKGKTIFKG